jgi:uncharacterized protein YegL
LNGTGVPTSLYALDTADKSATDGDEIGKGDQIVLNQTGNVITGTAGGTDYFTISVDPTNGEVTFTQINNIWHADTGSDDDTSTLNLSSANLLQLVQTVTDADGDSDTASLDLGQGVFQIEDDGPTAVPDFASVETPEGVDYNVAWVLDFSGSISNVELNTMLSAVKSAAAEIFNSPGSDDVTMQIVAFASSATSFGPFTSLADFEAQIEAINPADGGTRPGGIGSLTDYTDAINLTMSVYSPVAGNSNQVFFISDGNPNQQQGTGGNSLADATSTAWNTFVDNNAVNVTTIGVGNGVNSARLQDVDLDGSGVPILVDDFDDLLDTLLDEIASAPPISGNIVNGSMLNDDYGTDGGRVLSVTVDTEDGLMTYTWDGYDTITLSGAQSGTITGDTFTVTTGLGGSFTFYFDTVGPNNPGTWEYTAPVTTVPLQEVFNYQIIDGDGDVAGSTLETLTGHRREGPGRQVFRGRVRGRKAPTGRGRPGTKTPPPRPTTTG